MCLAVPGRVVMIDESRPLSRPGEVVFGTGEPRPVDLVMVPEAGVGDFVIVHSGFAIRRIAEEAALYSYLLMVGKPGNAEVRTEPEPASPTGLTH